MKNTLFSRILSDTDADAEKLDAWLSEREADRSLRSLPDDPLPFTVDAERLAAAVAPFDGDVEPGQIRILSAKFFSGDNALPFVAVLDRWMEALGKTHLQIARAKPGFNAIKDSQFDRAARSLSKLPREKQTLFRIFFTVLCASPSLIWKMRSFLK